LHSRGVAVALGAGGFVRGTDDLLLTLRTVVEEDDPAETRQAGNELPARGRPDRDLAGTEAEVVASESNAQILVFEHRTGRGARHVWRQQAAHERGAEFSGCRRERRRRTDNQTRFHRDRLLEAL